MNWYAYVGNDPINKADPTGKYGRGKGWTDKQWKQFDSAQKKAATAMSKASKSLKEQAAGMKKGEKTKDGYTSDNLNKMANSLDAGVKALNDSGTGGHFANAEAMSGSVAGTGEVGGKIITMNTRHEQFGDNQATQFTIGHESLHNAGLEHPKYMGFTPYRFGSPYERMSYEGLPTIKQITNPDHIMSQVYP